MDIVDTHTHLFLHQFDEDREAMIQRALDQAVTKCFLPNIDKDTINAMWKMTKDYEGICYGMMGLHPCSVDSDYKEHLQAIEAELQDTSSIYAVGETGLDFYWDDSHADAQREAFRQHIRWAKTLDLPIIIHCRNSFDAIVEMLQEENDKHLRGILHCFTGNVEQAHQILNLGGFYLGIGGIVTFKNAGLDKTVKDLPLDSLVLETDSPYLPPHPYRGKRNESSYTRIVAEKVAALHDLPLAKIANQTTSNAEAIFDVSLSQ